MQRERLDELLTLCTRVLSIAIVDVNREQTTIDHCPNGTTIIMTEEGSVARYSSGDICARFPDGAFERVYSSNGSIRMSQDQMSVAELFDELVH